MGSCVSIGGVSLGAGEGQAVRDRDGIPDRDDIDSGASSDSGDSDGGDSGGDD